jgi:hypothetical protein
MLYDLWSHDESVLAWIRAAAWYRGLPPVRGVAPNGIEATRFIFATGAFWAARTDVRAANSTGRILGSFMRTKTFCFSEALRQNGYTLGGFHSGSEDQRRAAPQRHAAEVRELRGITLLSNSDLELPKKAVAFSPASLVGRSRPQRSLSLGTRLASLAGFC